MNKKSDGDFDLIIPGGESKTLKCKAFFGSPSLEFSDRRINFSSIPLNIPTKKETYLKNTSRVPAIFAIESPENFPDLKIEPITGILPVGGIMKISMEYLPRHLHKFDFSLRARVRNGNKSEIRIGGAVEPPILSIDQSAFDFSGTPCG